MTEDHDSGRSGCRVRTGERRCQMIRIASVAARLMLGMLAALTAVPARGADPAAAQPVLKSESFDRDPAWEAHNNRIVAKDYPTIVQDFGYSKTNVAGKAAGEMGGQVWRASEPAYYADKIGPKTLDDPLHAAGTFAF